MNFNRPIRWEESTDQSLCLAADSTSAYRPEVTRGRRTLVQLNGGKSRFTSSNYILVSTVSCGSVRVVLPEELSGGDKKETS